MDLNMPMMDGFQCSREIVKLIEAYEGNEELKEAGKPSPTIVACTANDYQNEWERCRKAGMSSFLTKPPNKDDLKRILVDTLGAGHSPMLA